VRSACASLGHNAAHRLLQFTYDTRARRANGSSSPVNMALGHFALPSREVTQTTGSEPRGSLYSPAIVAFDLAIACTTPDEPNKLRLTSQSSEDRVRREARAKGSPKRAPLLVTPLEHPSYPPIASKGLEAPYAASTGRRPS
jgi:hypothetical protein